MVSGVGTSGHVGFRTLPPPPLRNLDNQPRLIQRMESGYESSERNSNSPVSLDMPLSESSSASSQRDAGGRKHFSAGPSWRSVPKSKSSNALLQDLKTSSWGSSHISLAGEGRSELDELQEEVTRRAREQELQRKKEKEKEAAMGFNPRPSKFMDLDELQNQGKGDSFERCLSEADALLEQSLQLEQGDDMAAALSVCNQAVSKLRLTMHEGCANTHSRTMADKKLQRCMRRARGLQQRMQQQEQTHPEGSPSEQPISVQVLLTDTEDKDQEADQNATLGPPSPLHTKPLPSCRNLPPDPVSHPSPCPPHLAGLPQKRGSLEDDGERLPPPPGPGECEMSGEEGARPLHWESAELYDVTQNSGLRVRPIHKHNAISLPSLALDWEDPDMEGEGGAQATPQPPPHQGMSATSDWNLYRSSPPVHTPSHSDPRPSLPAELSSEREYSSMAERYPQGYPMSPHSPRSPSRQPHHIPPRQDRQAPPSNASTRLAPPPEAHSWSSWSLDRQESMDSPFYTPPDGHCHPAPSKLGRSSSPMDGARPGPAMPVERWAENVNRYYNSQHALDPDRGSPSPELSELDSLYQASLQASHTPRAVHSSNSMAAGKPVMAAARKLLSGMAMPGRSKTPTAEIERNAYRAPSRASPAVCHHKPVSAGARELLPNDDESYSAENLRRIARSLSGTVIGGRPEHLATSHSFEPSVARTTKHVDTRVARHASTSPHLTASHNPPVFPSDPYHHQHHHHHHLHPTPNLSQQPLQPTVVAPPRGHSGDPQKANKLLAMLDRREALSSENYHSVALNYGTLPRAPRRAASGSALPPARDSTRGGEQRQPHAHIHYATLTHPRHSGPTGRSGPDRRDPVHYMQPQPLQPSRNGAAPGYYGTRQQPQHRYQTLPTPRPPPEASAQPVRLDVPPERDWRAGEYRKAHPTAHTGVQHHPQPGPRTGQYARVPHGRAPPCSLCQQMPAEPNHYYCYSCGIYMARFRPTSR